MEKLRGESGFDVFYKELFGKRWEKLKESLLTENVSVKFEAGGKNAYFLDAASIMAALMLPLENALNILDMCAAPGGKSLVLASKMNENATLLCNEKSRERFFRLNRTINDCLPEKIKANVKTQCFDGAKMCLKTGEVFDAILLDAPCSSERHVLNDKKYLEKWSTSRIKSLAIEQFALLSSAFRMLKSGGYLLYSTCALNHFEKDCVIERLLKKFDNAKICERSEIKNAKLPSALQFTITPEKTKYGYHILPDTQNGSGPIWWSLVEKQ